MISKIALSVTIFLFSIGSHAAFQKSEERLIDDEVALGQLEFLSIIDPSAALMAVENATVTVPLFKETSGSVFEAPDKLGNDWQWYPQAYGYPRMAGHSQISWGFIPMEGFQVLTVKMAPIGRSNKLVIFMHGYLDHSGNYTNFYDELIRNGISVVTFDLPGHGLSTGPRASIQNFEVYGKIISELTKKFGEQYDEVVLAGFSTGSSGILEARRLGLVDPSLRAIMIAPLYRIKHYWIAEPAFMQALNWKYQFGWTFLDSVLSPGRKPTVITHDKIFDKVLDSDPISPQIIPEAWTLSYIVYADRIEKWSDSLTDIQKESFGNTLVLQGDDDNVVDADQGTELLSRTFTNTSVKWIPNGRHALLNEGIDGKQDILPVVYESIIDFVNK